MAIRLWIARNAMEAADRGTKYANLIGACQSCCTVRGIASREALVWS